MNIMYPDRMAHMTREIFRDETNLFILNVPVHPFTIASNNSSWSDGGNCL